MLRFSSKAALLLTLAAVPAHGQDIITNPAFEDGWSGWTDIDPNNDATAISGHSFSGDGSAKITNDPGRFEQQITVLPESEYILRAVVKGPGTVGVSIDGTEHTAVSTGSGDDWIPLELPFASGAATSVVLFGAFNGGEGRFDDFSIEAVNGPAVAAAQEAASEAMPPPVEYASIPGGCDSMNQLRVRTASDDGSNDGHTPEMAIDGNFQPDSRWSSENPGKELILDMGMPQTLREIGLAFYKGDERQSFFAVSTSVDGQDFTPLIEQAESSGLTTAIERFDFDDRVARYIMIIGLGNDSNEWNSIVEVQPYGCGLGEIESQGDGRDTASVANVSVYGLATNQPPAHNFDLTNWKITLPIDTDSDGRADEISEQMLANGWSDETLFYTDPVTGGMVFRVYGGGATTQNSRYPRVELREMLRGGDESIPTRNDDGTPTLNNWVFSAAPEEAQVLAGAVDGTMTAQLSVNQVTRMGDSSQVGRVIIGQIHARDGEPIRLYYRKLPTNKYGAVYYIHEREGQDDIYVPIIGDRSDLAENPEDGIALDELFGYEISVTGEEIDGAIHPILNVTIIRDDGTEVAAPPLDMIDSNYAVENEFMYFKAGAYSQNNTTPWPERDFDQVTFFALDVTH